MDVLRLVEVRRDAELLRPLAQARECRAAALLHHVAQVARELDLAAAIHHADLDGQNFAAHLGPRKAVHHADKVLFGNLLLCSTRRTEEVLDVLLCHGDSLYIACGKLHCRLAADLAELPLKRAHAALARVERDGRADGALVHAQARGRQPVGLTLLGQQVPLRDLHLFLVRVAGDFNNLHAVEQRARNGVERVGRHDEHHAAQIDGNFKIVVAEGVVLLAVEHFEKCARGVAAPVASHLVDLVEHEQRIHRTAAGDSLDDAAGHRADVGLAVAADIRLVTHAAERQPRDLAVHRLGDRQRDRRLADARRADET